MDRVQGKVAVVTGAARGQGAAEARLLAAEGASVVLTDVLEDLGAQTAAGIGGDAVFVPHDVRSEEDWSQVVDTALGAFGRVDVLVNNAGVLLYEPFLTMDMAAYRHVVEVNQVGCLLGMRAVAGPMVEAGRGGSIVNTSSVSGIVGNSNLMAYTASKFAIRGMTKVAAIELGPHRVRVNSVHPGFVDTEMSRPPGAADMMSPEDQEAFISAFPLRRVAEPEDVARLVLFLASDDSAYCTGAEFVIDGGMLAGPT